jgi:hypothetical protein
MDTIQDILTQPILFGIAFLPFIGPAISALAGLFGGRKQKQEAFNEQDSSQVTSPELSYNQRVLSDAMTRALIDRLYKDIDLSGYTSGGLQTINQASDARNKIISNILAARGLSFSPAAATQQTLAENARLADASSFLNTIPLLSRQLQTENIENLMRGFNILPTATRTSGSTSQRGTQLIPGNMLGGAFSGAAQGLYAPLNKAGESALDILLRRFF